MGYLEKIIEEQIDFDQRVYGRIHKKYPTKIGKLFAKSEALQNEVAELKQELKPYWQWWRGEIIDTKDIVLSDAKRERMIEESMDCYKFLLSLMIELGIDSEVKFYEAYMKKHAIIHQRLEDAKNGKDNYLVFEGKKSLE